MSTPEVTTGFLPFRGHRTWYQVTGDLRSGKAPLIVVHGGPGGTHGYVQSFDQVADQGRAVILYDQLGCGRSTHLPDAPADFWTIDLFLEELDTLLATLGGQSAYHLLGQSWGGMLAAEHAVRRPAGLRSLILSNSLPSSESWARGAERLRGLLPPEILATLEHHEAAGTTGDPAYLSAVDAYYDRHMCRVAMPEYVAASFADMMSDPTVYQAMWGPNEFAAQGSLKDWSIVDRLADIDVPTFVVAGEFDEATSECQEIFVAEVPDVRSLIVPNASHLSFVEAPEHYFSALRDFLDEVEA